MHATGTTITKITSPFYFPELTANCIVMGGICTAICHQCLKQVLREKF
jgi:hypothetical protein